MEVAANFPDECRYVLEMLGQVYGHDAEARERSSDARRTAAVSSGSTAAR